MPSILAVCFFLRFVVDDVSAQRPQRPQLLVYPGMMIVPGDMQYPGMTVYPGSIPYPAMVMYPGLMPYPGTGGSFTPGGSVGNSRKGTAPEEAKTGQLLKDDKRLAGGKDTSDAKKDGVKKPGSTSLVEKEDAGKAKIAPAAKKDDSSKDKTAPTSKKDDIGKAKDGSPSKKDDSSKPAEKDTKETVEYYHLYEGHTKTCAIMADDGKAAAAPITPGECMKDQKPQQWSWAGDGTPIISRLNGKCMEAAQCQVECSEGSKVQAKPCNSGQNQNWYWTADIKGGNLQAMTPKSGFFLNGNAGKGTQLTVVKEDPKSSYLMKKL